MKTILQKLFFVTSMLLCVTNATAYDFEVDGIFYAIISSTNKTVEVTFRGDISSYRGNVVIPKKVTYNNETYNITSIGDHAFYLCTGLTSVTIPNSVTSIGYSAFNNCTEIKEVHISDLAAWCGIDFKDVSSNPLDYAHNLYLNGELVTELVIPDGINEIKQYAFYDCRELTSITIPNSVTSIGEGAFDGCTRLKTVVNFSNLTFTKGFSSYGYIARYAKNVINAPNGSIEEDYIFGKPNEVNTLLYYLGNRNKLNLPVDYKGENYVIGDNVFKNYTTLTSVTIPNSVTSIGESAFEGCTELESVTIGNSVTSIGESAFEGCTGLTSITIPNSVTSIGFFAFYFCI